MGKPLLFGDATLDGDRIDAIRRVDDLWDRSYVPGYGELRRRNELLVRAGRKPLPCPRLQWIRLGTVDGREVGDRDMIEWAQNGYQFMTPEDLKQYKFGVPPTAYVDAQGRIRREDLVLAFVDEEQHQRNIARQEELKASHRVHEADPEIAWEQRMDDHGDISTLGARYLDN